MNSAVHDTPLSAREPKTALSVRGLSVTYHKRGLAVEAVREADFDLKKGEVHALIGESGSGKSTIAFACAGLLFGDGVEITGSMRLESEDLNPNSPAGFRNIRGRKIGFVFQEPSTSLHPAMRISTQITEAIHLPLSRSKKKEHVIALLRKVRLPETSDFLRSYPHELSGGMQQRTILAMALANNPPLLFADEPTTALDPTTRRAILDQIKQNAVVDHRAILLITHDFGLVANYADKVSVLLKGDIVESGNTTEILRSPQHSYTRSLIAAVPKWEWQGGARIV